ncbi:hypothetical protein OF83DRAFT_1173934 [Amylostereum chailletii]|nr:hypothetical protein OF83DRAFT_1173934 [Amylostereum chailletii]
MLVRAKNMPLSVIQNIPPEAWHINYTIPTAFDSFIVLRFDDIRELSLRGCEWEWKHMALEVFPQASLPPSLRTLRLWNNNYSELPDEFPLDEAPLSVHNLSLENCFVPWHRLVRLFNLSTLEIAFNVHAMGWHSDDTVDPSAARIATYEELQSIFDASPGLESLVLEHCLPTFMPPPVFSHKSKLPKLYYLLLRGYLFGCVGVVQMIDMPTTAQISLNASSTDAVHGVGFPSLLEQMRVHADKAVEEGIPLDCLSLDRDSDDPGPAREMWTAPYRALLTRGFPVVLLLPWNLVDKPYILTRFCLNPQAGKPVTGAEVAGAMITALISQHIRHLFISFDLRWSVSSFVKILGPAHSIETLELFGMSAANFCRTLVRCTPRKGAAGIYLPNLRRLYLCEIDHHLDEHGWRPYETLPDALLKRKECGSCAELYLLVLSYNWRPIVVEVKGFRERIEAVVPNFFCQFSSASTGPGGRPTSRPQSRGSRGSEYSREPPVGHQIPGSLNNLTPVQMPDNTFGDEVSVLAPSTNAGVGFPSNVPPHEAPQQSTHAPLPILFDFHFIPRDLPAVSPIPATPTTHTGPSPVQVPSQHIVSPITGGASTSSYDPVLYTSE